MIHCKLGKPEEKVKKRRKLKYFYMQSYLKFKCFKNG